DIAFWDSRSTVHLAPTDIFESDFDRQLYRVTLVGKPLVGVDGQPSKSIEGVPILTAAEELKMLEAAEQPFEVSLERAMKENSIRRAVREGRAALGTGLKEFASRGVPWIIEAAGFDYCAVDHEHGAFDMETIANLASWFQATNVSAIVR